MTSVPLTGNVAPESATPRDPAAPPVGRTGAASRVMQLGALAAVVAVSLQKAFELDRFFVPKELALHLTVLLAGVLAVRALRRLAFTFTDLMLSVWVLLNAVSALLATNRWLGFRALALSASAAGIFWIARACRESGLAPRLLRGTALAIVVVAATSLLQTYGVESELFSLNRAPGGTLGNRNSVGHAMAFGLPVVLLAALAARRLIGFFAGAAGVSVVAGTLVLTRSRAAWLAAAAVVVVFALAMFFSRALRRDGRTWRRLLFIVVLTLAGVAAALLVPNSLRWRSDNPYLETAASVAEFEEGSGRGRLVQYERSLRMAAAEPLFGAGPGNWAVGYPGYAARRDPSMNGSEPGTTFNPWPSSDWVAFVSERGFPATLALLAAFATMALSSFRRMLTADDAGAAITATALAATLVAAGIAGAFDAVLLLGMPALLVWMVAGAAWAPPRPSARTLGLVPLLLVLLAAGGAVRSVSQLVAMELYTGGPAALSRAAQIDPGNYRVRLRLARDGPRKARCAHARAAHALYPNAQEAAELARRCGG